MSIHSNQQFLSSRGVRTLNRPAASGPTSASGMDMDEELAAALFQSFAGIIVGYTSDIEEQTREEPSVPTDVKASASA